MPIEIRELVIRATIEQKVQRTEDDFVKKSQIRHLKKKIIEETLSRVKDMIEENRTRY